MIGKGSGGRGWAFAMDMHYIKGIHIKNGTFVDKCIVYCTSDADESTSTKMDVQITHFLSVDTNRLSIADLDCISMKGKNGIQFD